MVVSLKKLITFYLPLEFTMTKLTREKFQISDPAAWGWWLVIDVVALSFS